MEKVDDLSGALLLGAGIGLFVLLTGIAIIIFWQYRFRPSRPTTYAVWAGFIWAYYQLAALSLTPLYLMSDAVESAVLWGVAIVVIVWAIARLLHRSRPG